MQPHLLMAHKYFYLFYVCLYIFFTWCFSTRKKRGCSFLLWQSTFNGMFLYWEPVILPHKFWKVGRKGQASVIKHMKRTHLFVVYKEACPTKLQSHPLKECVQTNLTTKPLKAKGRGVNLLAVDVASRLKTYANYN